LQNVSVGDTLEEYIIEVIGNVNRAPVGVSIVFACP
jgi:hypothetical protein